MKRYILGIFKYNLRNLFKIRKNTSLFSLIDCNSQIDKNAFVARGCKLSNVIVKEYSYISKGSEINNCTIGKFCSIAPGVKIGFGKHPTNLLSTSPLFYTNKNVFRDAFVIKKDFNEFEETIIGNDVWIGMNSIILDGVIIGDGSIIGAGAVVTKNVEPYSIVAGVPAKVVKYRFDEDIIKLLLESKWWDLPKEDIIEISNYLDLQLKKRSKND